MDYITWAISAMSIIQIWLAGNKNKNAWILTIANQFLWLSFILHSENYGLLPITVAYFVIAARNHVKWNRKE